MTDEHFEKGYKLLKRYFKEINRYPDFLRITAKNNPQYKTKLKYNFNFHENCGWPEFFTYTWFVGEDYEAYNDQGLIKLRDGWHNFMREHNKELYYN